MFHGSMHGFVYKWKYSELARVGCHHGKTPAIYRPKNPPLTIILHYLWFLADHVEICGFHPFDTQLDSLFHHWYPERQILQKRSISVLKRSPAYDQLNPFTHAPGLHELEENHNLQCLSHGWKYESRLQSRSTLTAIVSACYITICGGVNFFRQKKNEKLDIFKITAAKF